MQCRDSLDLPLYLVSLPLLLLELFDFGEHLLDLGDLLVLHLHIHGVEGALAAVGSDDVARPPATFPIVLLYLLPQVIHFLLLFRYGPQSSHQMLCVAYLQLVVQLFVDVLSLYD